MTGIKHCQHPPAFEALLLDAPAVAAREWPSVVPTTAPAAGNATPTHPQQDGRPAEEDYEPLCRQLNANLAVEDADLDPEVRRLLETDGLLRAIADIIPPGGDFAWVSPGEKLGEYTIVRELGRGTFAQVYLATEASTGDRPVVLKLTYGDITEAQMLGRLSHDNIVRVLSAGKHESGLSMLCMPYLGSATLHNVLDRAYPTDSAAPPRRARILLDVICAAACPDDPVLELGAPPSYVHHGTWIDAVARIGAQLATGLAFVHRHGIYHRDLKPSNILLDAACRPLLLDFNLSRDQRLDQSRVGGTLPYMSAEQLRVFLRGTDDLEEPDGRADLFALGVILYELLTGQHPFGKLPQHATQEKMALLLLKRQKAGCTPVRHHNTQVDRGLATLIESCLAFEASDRPVSAAAVAAVLERRFAPTRRLRNLVCLAAALLLALGGGAAPFVPKVLATVLAPAPLSPAEEYQHGCAAFKANNYHSADGHFTRALAKDSENAAYLFARGRCRLALGDATGAAGYFETALTMRPKDPQLLAALARSELLAGQSEWALKHFEQAQHAGCQPTAAFYHQRAHARLMAGLGNKVACEAALADLQAALTEQPDYGPAHYTRLLVALQKYAMEGGWSRKDVGIVPEALADAQFVATRYGQYAEAHYWAGYAYAALAETPNSETARDGVNEWRLAATLGWNKKNLAGAGSALTRLGKEACLQMLKEAAGPKEYAPLMIPAVELLHDPTEQWLEN